MYSRFVGIPSGLPRGGDWPVTVGTYTYSHLCQFLVRYILSSNEPVSWCCGFVCYVVLFYPWSTLRRLLISSLPFFVSHIFCCWLVGFIFLLLLLLVLVKHSLTHTHTHTHTHTQTQVRVNCFMLREIDSILCSPTVVY